MKKLLWIAMIAAPLRAQEVSADIDRALEKVRTAQDRINKNNDEIRDALKQLANQKVFTLDPYLSGLDTLPLMTFAPQDDRAREAAERAREALDRSQELYRDATQAIDEQRYDRAIERLDRVIDSKSPRADGAYYWKAYALNKLGKRDEALAALAQIPKQFPQSRWINDAKALQVEISGASPENQSDQDLKLLAINALINSEPDRAVPLLEKVINDPKNNVGLRGRALFVLAQSRNDKARDIVAQYAKSGSNPDLQLRAVSYLGAFRSKDSQQALADIYAANNNPDVRRAVLRSMMMARDSAHLLNAARTEPNADLRREVIRGLGMMRASAELAQLYSSETNSDLKETIIQSLWMARDTGKLIDIAKSEKDAHLRASAIQKLGLMRDPKANEALAAMYSSESDKTVRVEILTALWQSGACKPLVEAVRGEKDPAVKAEGVRRLSMIRGCKEASDYLLEILSK
ncbi:MAG TPA: HEAT repeat domain-containing protein [Bryobacteraceae bacterium]|jgi:tetratricopeptide (TPR) repeat protein|nr:HEAT repeat domain-containing protein [Bryobacteraceae bacterium]